jgi:hypothetical protein
LRYSPLEDDEEGTMTTRTYGGYGLRKRDPVPSRVPRTGERFEQMLANAERGIADPFVGITTDGVLVPGLFPLGGTGVSTAPIRAAAETFLAMSNKDFDLFIEMYSKFNLPFWMDWRVMAGSSVISKISKPVSASAT